MSPITPSFSAKLYAQLGFDDTTFERLRLTDATWGELKEGHLFPKATPTFQRIEGDLVTNPPGTFEEAT